MEKTHTFTKKRTAMVGAIDEVPRGDSGKRKMRALIRYTEQAAKRGSMEDYREWRFTAIAAGLMATVERCDEIWRKREVESNAKNAT